MPISGNIYFNLSENGKPGSIPLVLIHGAGGTNLGWHARIRRMPDVNVYALDLPGHGKSSGEGRHTITGYAEDVLNWMQNAGLYRAFIAGHSLGGMIAMQAVLNRPERFQGLMMISSSPECLIPVDVIQGLINPETSIKSIDWLVEKLKNPLSDTKWAEQTRLAISQTRRGVLYGDLSACSKANLTARIKELVLPILVCFGNQDRFFLPSAARHFAKQLSQAEIEVTPRAGHLLPLEYPDELIEKMNSFMHQNLSVY